MSNKKNQKENRRRRIKFIIRKKVSGTPERPRLSVYKSNKSVYCQLIDDVNGITLARTHTSAPLLARWGFETVFTYDIYVGAL